MSRNPHAFTEPSGIHAHRQDPYSPFIGKHQKDVYQIMHRVLRKPSVLKKNGVNDEIASVT